MMPEHQLRQSIRQAIVVRLEDLKDEAVHWLNELKKLDHPESISAETDERPPTSSAQ